MNKPSITALLLVSLLLFTTVKAVDLSSHSQTSFTRSQADLDAQVETEQSSLYPAVDNLYNIFIGNPLSASDPGFQTFEVYTLNWEGGTTQDKRFKLPKEFYDRDLLSCSTDASSESVKGMSSYQKSLHQNAKLDVSADNAFFSASFQGSVDYQSRSEAMQKQETVSTIRKLGCQTYRISLSDNIAKTLNPLLVRQFVKTHTDNAWEAFVRRYGAHYVSEATYGAMAVEETSLSKTDAEMLETMGLDVSVAVRGSYKLVKGGASSNTKMTSEQNATLGSVRTKSSAWVVGISPDPNNPDDFNAWVDRVMNGKLVAQPVEIKLTSLDRVFDIDNFPANSGVDEKTVIAMRNAFNAAALKVAKSYPPVPADIPSKPKTGGRVSPNSIANGFYVITNKMSKMALDIEGTVKTQDRLGVIQWPEYACACQVWYFERLINDVYRIKSKMSEKYMEVRDQSRDERANIQINAWNDGPHQKWTFQYNKNDNSYSFINMHTGLGLDIPLEVKNGQRVQQFTLTTATEQHWFLRKVD